MKAAALLLLLLSSTQTLAWKVAVISDVHLNVNYLQNVSAATYCEIDGKTQHTAWTDILAPLGRIGCDPPPALFERFLQRLNETEQPDILFMPGDFLGHSIPIEYPYIWDDARFAKLLSVHKLISDMLAKYLSTTLIIPTFGNNDWLFHYQAPYESNKTNFYPKMFEYWFKGQGVSGGRKDLAEIEETFNEGGYYRMDINKYYASINIIEIYSVYVYINEKMSVLALNTLMWNTRNEYAMQGPQIEAQFNWLEQQLSGAKDGLKFILTSHIYAGQQYWVNDESNVWDQWNDDFLTRYANIVKKYKDNILIEICGHDHIADFRFSNQQYSPSRDGDYLVHNMIIAPAVTSASYSEPGYLFFNMDETTLQASDIRLVFLPIEQTYLQKGDPSEKFMFRTVDLKRFGLNDLSLQSFQTMKGLLMEDNNLLIKYIFFNTFI